MARWQHSVTVLIINRLWYNHAAATQHNWVLQTLDEFYVIEGSVDPVDPIRRTRAWRWRNGKFDFQNYALVKLQSVC